MTFSTNVYPPTQNYHSVTKTGNNFVKNLKYIALIEILLWRVIFTVLLLRRSFQRAKKISRTVETIPIIVDALGTIPEGLKGECVNEYQRKNWDYQGHWSAKILRSVLETWEELLYPGFCEKPAKKNWCEKFRTEWK